MVEKLLLAMAQSDDAPIVICALDGSIAYMNRAATERYHGNFVGKSIHILYDRVTGAVLVVDESRM